MGEHLFVSDSNPSTSVEEKTKPKLVVIMGATGSGKSRLSIDISSFFPIEIINADSMQAGLSLHLSITHNNQTPFRFSLPPSLLSYSQFSGLQRIRRSHKQGPNRRSKRFPLNFSSSFGSVKVLLEINSIVSVKRSNFWQSLESRAVFFFFFSLFDIVEALLLESSVFDEFV